MMFKTALCHHVLAYLKLPSRFEPTFDLSPYLNLLPGKSDTEWENIFQSLPEISNSRFNSKPEDAQTLQNYHAETFGQLSRLKNSASLPDPEQNFELWAGSIEAETQAIPGTRAETGVTLAQEFKLLSALVHATQGQVELIRNGFTLVSGDFPGIQRVIYTIASDGAAKGVRGRSFFLQFLGECVVRAVLASYRLPLTNALYVTGGKFLLLLPYGANVSGLSAQFNKELLALFEGDLSLVLASMPLPVDAIKQHITLTKTYDQLKQAETVAKFQPFRSISPDDLFTPVGGLSSYFCAVSRREPRESELKDAKTSGTAWVSPEQDAFNKLAEDLARVETAHHKNYLIYTTAPTIPDRYQERLYPGLLHRITGWSAFLITDDHAERDNVERQLEYSEIISLNHISDRARSFRFFALHTPRVSKSDEVWWKKKYRDAPNPARVGQIRNFELLATQGKDSSFARFGILRMDIDSLGDVFKDRLLEPTLTRRMALSSAVSTFFDAYLPLICQQVESSDGNSLYLIYGGGDDLFIVGEWHILPDLAQKIHDLLHEYSSGRLSISAGIQILPAHFPFYVGANLAKEALDNGAKNYKAPSREKNAISIFGEVFGWQDAAESWATLRSLKQTLLDIRKVMNNQETIIRNMQQIYAQWQQDRETHNNDAYNEYGPFRWLTAYKLTQLAERRDEAFKAQIRNLIEEVIRNPRLCGIAARWAEFEVRTEE
jgi:CRISPR-associated protein Csm1